MLSESDNRFYKIQKSIICEKDAQMVIDGFHMGMFEPVLLTEDIIKKIRGSIVIADKSIQRKVFKYKQFAFIVGPDEVQVQVINMPVASCQTLHELQNIYTSLTGDDLSINL